MLVTHLVLLQEESWGLAPIWLLAKNQKGQVIPEEKLE